MLYTYFMLYVYHNRWSKEVKGEKGCFFGDDGM